MSYAVILIEFMVLVYAGSRPSRDMLVAVGVSSNMVLITVFAPYLIEVFGFVTNIGAVLYAGVVASQIVILERWGPLAARDVLPMVYPRLVMMFAVCSFLSLLPVVPGNEEFASAAHVVATHQLSVVVACFAAFALSQMVLVMTYGYIRRAVGQIGAVVLGMVLCQAVDSPIFFGVAFYDMAPADLVTFIATGWMVKCVIGLVLTPAIFAALWLARPSSVRRDVELAL